MTSEFSVECVVDFDVTLTLERIGEDSFIEVGGSGLVLISKNTARYSLSRFGYDKQGTSIMSDCGLRHGDR